MVAHGCGRADAFKVYMLISRQSGKCA